ncbi:MAG: 3'(2'),5'-bisphosphate nucleotidase [Thermoguttaceae bacterium]|nr:3'(2'),5'-bisphosphate nucleotidase [Thermoguttaceae bacterium]
MKQIESILSILRDAADLTTRIQNDFITPATWEKKDKSPVTVGDLAVQTLVAARLEELCPEVPLIAEESADLLVSEDGKRFLDIIVKYVGKYLEKITAEKVVNWISRGKNDDSLKGAPKFWTLDPIDGTKGFLRKEQYATALALVENGEVTTGFLGLPNLTWLKEKHDFTPEKQSAGAPWGALLYAKRGEGTWISDLGSSDFVKLHVSEHSDPNDASVLRSVEAGHTNLSQIDILCREIGVPGVVAMDSQAKYAVLAAGRSDLLFRLISPKMPDYREKIWDQAAGSIVVEEAGGRITDLDGRPLDFSQGAMLLKNRGICASNGLLHDLALKAIEKIGA